MKDNSHKDLEDFGWESMRHILDKEMPIQETDTLSASHSDDIGSASIKQANGGGIQKYWIAFVIAVAFIGLIYISNLCFKSPEINTASTTIMIPPVISEGRSYRNDMPSNKEANSLKPDLKNESVTSSTSTATHILTSKNAAPTKTIIKGKTENTKGADIDAPVQSASDINTIAKKTIPHQKNVSKKEFLNNNGSPVVKKSGENSKPQRQERANIVPLSSASGTVSNNSDKIPQTGSASNSQASNILKNEGINKEITTQTEAKQEITTPNSAPLSQTEKNNNSTPIYSEKVERPNNVNAVENSAVNKIFTENNNNTIALLPVVQASPLTFKKRLNALIFPLVPSSIIRPNDKDLSLKWGFSMGVNSVMDKQKSLINGFQMGLSVIKPLSAKWSITTGLRYSSTIARGDSLSYFKIDSASPQVLMDSSGTTPKSAAVTTAQPIRLNGLRYIEMPICVSYNINQKWGLMVGIKGAYLVSKSFTVPNNNLYLINTSTTAGDPLMPTSSNYIHDTKSNTELGLDKWDFSLIGGVSYSPLKNISFNAQYMYGVNNIFRKTNWITYNRYLGFNMTYMF